MHVIVFCCGGTEVQSHLLFCVEEARKATQVSSNNSCLHKRCSRLMRVANSRVVLTRVASGLRLKEIKEIVQFFFYSLIAFDRDLT